jgi:hypothetical protein
VFGKRRGYPVAIKPRLRTTLPTFFRTAFGRFFRLGHPDTIPLSKARRVQVRADNPFSGIGHDIGQLQKSRRGGVEPSDPVYPLKATVMASGLFNHSVKCLMVIVMIHVRNHVNIADFLSTQHIPLELLKPYFHRLNDSLCIYDRGFAPLLRHLLID